MMKLELTSKQYFLFDLDGTLVDLERMNFACFAEATKKVTGKELSFEEYMTHMAGVGSERGFERYFKSVGATNFKVKEVVAGYRERKRFYLENHFDEVVSVKAGAIEFLQNLKNLGKKTALGTSTVRPFAELIIQKSGIDRYLDAVVSVSEVKRTKPAPDIFLEALRQIGGTKEQALIFEDSPNGVQCAKNTGIDFVVIHNPGKNDQVVSGAENAIEDYRELLPLL